MQQKQPIAPINRFPAPDYDDWAAAIRAEEGIFQPHTWFNCEWFFAETYAYRCVMQAVRWFETGRDPFAPKKSEELAGGQLWALLDEALQFKGSPTQKVEALLAFALWGNRIDLSYAASHERGATNIGADDLLADDRPQVMQHICEDESSLKAGTVHIIADNTGSELAMDLALIDALLKGGVAQVILHVKAHPTFVSDAIPADVWNLISAMESRAISAQRLAIRLTEAWLAKRFIISPDFFWNSRHFIWKMPPSLATALADALLVIVKGDANYRRLVGDAIWPVETPFSDVMDGFPAPIVALRTLKSDPVVGLAPGTDDHLDNIDPTWRVNGQRGVIQFSG
jgi:uncharacterized protein with ATP-grasp and redox domains